MIAAAFAAGGVMALWIRSYSVHWENLHALIAQLHWWPLPAILVLLACHVALAAARWTRIERALGADGPRFQTAFTVGAIALGLGTVLPGPLTNIGSRALSNRLGGNDAIRGAVSGTIDQLADLAIALLFIPAAIIGVATQSVSLYAAAIAASSAAGFAMLSVAKSLLAHVSRLSLRRRQVEALARTGALRPIYWLSLLRFACLTAITMLVHFATGAATLSAVIIAIPLVTVAISIAMLPGGFGVSEWSFSAVFATLGVKHEQIVTFVLGNRILLSAGALLVMSVAAALASVRGANSRSGRGTAKAVI